MRRSDGDKIGTIERVMIEKRSGKVAYAVMSFGGFMGSAEDYYTLPWSVLKYNTQLDAYELNLSEDQLRGAPAARRKAATPHTTANGRSTCTATTTQRHTGASEPGTAGRPSRSASPGGFFALSASRRCGAAAGLHEDGRAPRRSPGGDERSHGLPGARAGGSSSSREWRSRRGRTANRASATCRICASTTSAPCAGRGSCRRACDSPAAPSTPPGIGEPAVDVDAHALRGIADLDGDACRGLGRQESGEAQAETSRDTRMKGDMTHYAS